ncbi:MAG: ABC transporter permease [Firmicutes bacterium]|nr:ABC transporter permease [Bacillota bacterium]
MKKWTLSRIWEYCKVHPKVFAGALILFVFLILSLLGQVWTPFSVTKMDPLSVSQSPSLLHIFGTDNFGRDVFSRVINGCGITVLVALLTNLVGGGIGILVGSLTGYFGGSFDQILMRINDMLLSFPSVLLALLLISFLGPGTLNVVLALGILFIPSYARIARGEVIRFKDRDFVRSARLQGVSPLRIIFLHILPNARISLFTAAAIGFNNAVLAEASMSYLGLGLQPPTPSLGRMLFEAQSYLLNCPWYALFPGITIILMILGAALLSEGLKES